MSIIPNEELKSADSLELITFGLELIIDAPDQAIDIYSRVQAFWKSAVLRNLQGTQIISYQTSPNGIVKIVNPNSEIPLKGWGSYLSIHSEASTPNGRVDFECVSLKNARKEKINAS